jgi:hypothetical protein
MKRKISLGVVTLSLFLASGSTLRAEDDHRLDAAWKAAMQDNEGLLTPAQTASLNTLAFESAVARLCDGFKLDEAKFAASVSELVKGGEKLNEEEEVQRLSAIMYGLGTANGLFMAEGATKKDDFCASAAEQKADTENKHNWQ